MPSPLVSRDARELGLLAGDHHEPLAVFDDHAEAVEQAFGEQAPLAVRRCARCPALRVATTIVPSFATARPSASNNWSRP